MGTSSFKKQHFAEFGTITQTETQNSNRKLSLSLQQNQKKISQQSNVFKYHSSTSTSVFFLDIHQVLPAFLYKHVSNCWKVLTAQDFPYSLLQKHICLLLFYIRQLQSQADFSEHSNQLFLFLFRQLQCFSCSFDFASRPRFFIPEVSLLGILQQHV